MKRVKENGKLIVNVISSNTVIIDDERGVEVGRIHRNGFYDTLEEITSTAELFAEASNVQNACGFTPQQLLDQRNDLLNACEWALSNFRRLSEDGKYPEFMLARNGGDGVMPLVKAITEATKNNND